MDKPPFSIEDFVKQAAELLPGESARADAQKNFRALVQAALEKMDVVSRAEFDAQADKLRRCQEQLAALEKELQLLSES
ncbi:MAG: Membrane fusogenic [Pseudomonadota bacterium]|jgi:BMFP domain-containing protein YqiC